MEALDGVRFRKHAGASGRDRAMAEAAIIDTVERYLAIEHILDISSDTDWIEEHRFDCVASEAHIDKRADELRDAWHLGMDPIPSLCELLEDKGIKVVETDLPESISGLSCHVLRGGETVAEAVVVSGRVGVERRRFTLAREIARRIVRSTGSPAIGLKPATNRFAAAFLVPGRHLMNQAGRDRHRTTYHEIMRLKHLYGVPAAIILARLGQVGALPAASVKRASATFAKSWHKSEPDPIRDKHGFATLEKPRRFDSLVSRALGEELISPVRAAVLLGQSLDCIEQRISGPTIQ